ncbi:MAG TPA: hypothetical protein VGG27_08350 [Magnetospirillaceae bacterium]|jgi:hypothetical protein
MGSGKYYVVTVLAALALGGCSTVNDALFPPEAPASSSGASQQAAPAAQNSAPAPAPAAAAEPAPAPAASAPAMSSGATIVGQKAAQLASDLDRLKSTIGQQRGQMQQITQQIISDSETYHGTIAAIEAHLQLGTTPGNPVLTRQWSEAQGELDRINSDVLQMNKLSSDVGNDASLAAYLLDSVRAARSLSGGVDEDFRRLSVLEDDTNATTVQIDRLLTELSTDIQRQQQYVSSARNDLNVLALAIKNGQLYGSSLSSSRILGGSIQPIAASSGERPLVVIRFDRPNVSYENALYTAVKGALDRRPTATFEVVAVSSTSGTPGSTAISETTSRRNADQVVRSLTQMGLNSDRVRLSTSSSATAGTGEVDVFVH